MKSLYLNRHAKSSWDNQDLSDIERPLNNRGKRDAPLMGKVLSEKITTPQIIYSSPAIRAISTAKQIVKYFGINEQKIIIDQRIYDAVVSDIMQIINSIPDSYNTAMLFGHNPGFTMVTNYLSDKQIDNLPTCGFVQIDFDSKSWNEIEGNSGKLILFEYPKKYLK